MYFWGSYFSIEKLDVMCCLGLYINDLSMHDSSRDLVLAGTQQSAELRLALDQVRSPLEPLRFVVGNRSIYKEDNILNLLGLLLVK